VIFYFAASLLVATVLCYLIFILKIYLQEQAIKNLDVETLNVGTDAQKDEEKIVFGYQKKVNDYGMLLQNHKFASNVFSFLEKDTLPNVWFYRFSMPMSQNQIDLAGEAETMDALSRQTSAFEKNEFVKKVSILNSDTGVLGKISFNLSLQLDPKIFNYITPPPPEIVEEETTNPEVILEPEMPAIDKLITSFDLPLDPEVVGVIDQEKRTVTLSVPQGTDLSALAPRINLSPKATVMPVPDEVVDFTTPVVYTVAAEDGSQQSYTVTVAIASASEQSAETSKSKTGIIFAIISLAALIIAVGLGIFFFLRKRSKDNNKNNVAQNGF